MCHSEFAKEKIFSDTYGATSLALIEEFSSLDELAYMNTDELTEFIKTKGRNHFEDPEAIAFAVQKAAKNSYRPPQVIADSVNQALAISISTIRLLQKHLGEYDKAIEKDLGTITQTLTSIKGIGNVYAAGIIAEIGDINRFPKEASVAKFLFRSVEYLTVTSLPPKRRNYIWNIGELNLSFPSLKLLRKILILS